MAEIRLENIGHSYDGGTTYALNPLNLTWKDGNAIALLGPSGCGKTTLLNIISGLITPSSGRVYFDGVDVTESDTARRNVAQVFQFPVLYDTMTVSQNLAFPLKNRGISKDEISKRIAEVAELLDLTKYLDERPLRLRSDLQQLVSLGRGLVRKDVPAILFDEPLTVIDQNFKWTLRGRLKELHRVTKHTLVYVTHDQTEALTFADEVVVLNEGSVVQSGSSADLFLQPEHEFVGFFIGSPGMNFLNASITNGLVVLNNQEIGSAKSFGGQNLDSGSVRIGVRPEFLTISNSNGLPVQIDRVENRGGYQLAHFELAGSKTIAKLSNETKVARGQSANLVFDQERTYLFRESQLCGRLVSKVS